MAAVSEPQVGALPASKQQMLVPGGASVPRVPPVSGRQVVTPAASEAMVRVPRVSGRLALARMVSEPMVRMPPVLG